MLLELNAPADDWSADRSTGEAPPIPAAWSVLVPFFNEADFLAGTIAGLGAQSVAVRLILIDNGSTDGSAAIARATCEELNLDYLLLTERRPGKVEALKSGLRWVRTPFVATCDADTFYPADYLAEAQAVLERDNVVVAGAYFIAPDADEDTRQAAGRKMGATARLLPRQCHTGGAGQAFRTAALRRAGGFDAQRWGYVLEDHEVIHRMMKLGEMRYSQALWCVPSPRPRNRDSIRWTLAERLMYSATAPWAGDWFFYSFLSRRLDARRLTSQRIRERPHQGEVQFEGRKISATAYPVCG